MSRIFLMGDAHIGLGYPNKEDKWFKIHQEYFRDFFIPLLKREVRDGDICVCLGDLYDNRDVIPINIINYVMDVVEQISSILPFHIIIGNHDLWSKSASEINSIRPLRYMPNVYIYDSPRVLEYNGKNILMCPYVDTKKEQIDIIRRFNGCDYLFCHSDLNGCRMHLTSVAHRNNDKIDIEEFNGFEKVRSGHIHIVQEHNNFTFVGSIFQMDRNDYGNQKGIFILNTEDGSEEFVPNYVSPIFKKIIIKNEDDVEKLTSLNDNKNFIDLSISNKLLINSRKIRRIIESTLSERTFESVSYLNDIQAIEVDDINIELDENAILTSVGSLDYNEMIEKYISSLSYSNEDVKHELLDMYKEISDLYKRNYIEKGNL